MPLVCHNGAFLPAEQPLFTAANRGFRYGDGLFETARFYKAGYCWLPIISTACFPD
jgi:branched-subunit amino acid aminotransferase/4-amino-4-deoxychorismate lyase